jgi:hypothetical protein
MARVATRLETKANWTALALRWSTAFRRPAPWICQKRLKPVLQRKPGVVQLILSVALLG